MWITPGVLAMTRSDSGDTEITLRARNSGRGG
jgi:hypothetical protein